MMGAARLFDADYLPGIRKEVERLLLLLFPSTFVPECASEMRGQAAIKGFVASQSRKNSASDVSILPEFDRPPSVCSSSWFVPVF